MLPIFLKPSINLNLTRIGSLRDGGYYIPKKIINKIDKIISLGLGSDWSFEEKFKEKRNSIKIVFYDHSINVFFWLKLISQTLYYSIRYQSSLKNLFKYFNYITFFSTQNILHLKFKISSKTDLKKKTISLTEILKKEKKNILLKIDIEGDEYKILNQIIKHQKAINCLIIEFHRINKNLYRIKNFLKKMKNFENCNISPNNSFGFDKNNDPYVFEIVLINKKLIDKKDYSKKIFLRALPNNPFKKNYRINFKK